MDTILLLQFDETHEPTFHRLHCARPFSYVHLTVSSTNEIEGRNIFALVEGNFLKKEKEIDSEDYYDDIVRIKTFRKRLS